MIPSRRLVGGALAAFLLACTAEAPDRVPESPHDPSPSGGVPLEVVASLTGPTHVLDRSYVDGMRVAVSMVNRWGGVDGQPLRLKVSDDGGDPARSRSLVRGALESGRATLVVGPGAVIAAARPDVERDGDPVFLLRGDLYSSRALFRQVFQTSPPLAWQAEVVARYLSRDRGYDDALLVTASGLDERATRRAFESALRAEGSSVAGPLSLPNGGDVEPSLDAAARVDAVVFAGDIEPGRVLASHLDELKDPPQLALSSEGLVTGAPVPRGAVAPGQYTWAPWADPIPRVHRFRARVERLTGHGPRGFEQEGHDAIRVLADALNRTTARGGPALIRALESARAATYSSTSIRLGPDSHVLVPRGQLGLFAVAGSGDRREPWFQGRPRWTPLMRTFTYNELRTNIPKADWEVFFPRWPKRAGPPEYRRSRYGVTTGPGDPLH